ncbi:MAG: fluoride efflux transporter CrcB [Candidatus Latescibacteria bacterium]|nr:fluoride efflux transporter CrcB [Candidatus Latescibacterota bacterium]
MRGVLLVGCGGFIGSALRYLVTLGVQRLLGTTTFPYGILVANSLGCLLIGLLAGLTEMRPVVSPQTRLFLFVGLLGGFTTYSTFANDTFLLLRSSNPLTGLANIAAQILLGLAAVWLGYRLGRAM